MQMSEQHLPATRCVILLLLCTTALVQANDQVQTNLLFKPDGCERSRRAQEGDIVFMHYTGKLQDGSVFDSSLSRDPFEFTIGKSALIEGWHQGIQGMCVGERRLLRIPPSLAYGVQGIKGRIPPSATLTFEVELVSFDKDQMASTPQSTEVQKKPSKKTPNNQSRKQK